MLVSHNSLVSEIKQKQAQLHLQQTQFPQKPYSYQNPSQKLKKNPIKPLKKSPKKSQTSISHSKKKHSSKRHSLSPIKTQPHSYFPSNTQKSRTQKPVQIPVHLPQSAIRKAQKLPPPTYQKVLRNGQVITVHLLNQQIPAFDPLVKTKAHIGKKDLLQMSKQMNLPNIKEVIQTIQDQMSSFDRSANQIKKRSSSLSPNLRKKLRIEQNFKVQKGCQLPVIVEKSPQKTQVFQYAYREFPCVQRSASPENRPWVFSRMQEYGQRVRKQFLPKANLKKELQLSLLHEKSYQRKSPVLKRVKLSSLD